MALATELGPRVVHAQPVAVPASAAAPAPVTLAWDAPADCAAAERVEVRVAELLGSRAPTSTLTAHARVTSVAGGALHLTLVLDPDGVPRERTLEAATCAELVRATALILALALDPNAAPAAPRFAELPPPCPVAPPVVAPSVAAPGPEPSSLPPRAPLVLLGGAGDEPRGAARPSGALGLGARADVGVLPGIAPGLLLVGELAPGRWLLELAVAALDANARDPATKGRGASLVLVEGAARGCWTARHGRVEVGPCVGVAAGALHGRGFGVLRPASATEPWLAARGGVALRLRPRGAGAFWLDGDLVLPVLRPGFDLAGHLLFRAAPAGFALGTGFALTFE